MNRWTGVSWSGRKELLPKQSPGGALVLGFTLHRSWLSGNASKAIWWIRLWEGGEGISGLRRGLINLRQQCPFNAVKHSSEQSLKTHLSVGSSCPLPLSIFFRRTITPQTQNVFKEPGKCCWVGIMVKIANLTEFQKNWSLPAVPGWLLP